jgi:predicted transcriptional regulator
MIDFEKLGEDLGIEPPAPVKNLVEQVADSMAEHSGDYDERGNKVEMVQLPAIEDSATFSVEEIPEPDELIEGLVHKGTKVVIGGGSKSFKTWVQLDAAVSVAYGLTWMGRPTKAGKVLFINFEIKRAFFQRRIKKICEARGITQIAERLDIWNLRGFCAGYKEIIPLIIQRIKDQAYAMVVIDPIYKLYGDTDENSAHEVAQMLNSLEKVCVETDAAVMFGAHYSKGNQASKEAIDRVSGSGVFARDPDSIIPFTKHEEEGCFSVEPILRNLPPIDGFVVRWNHPLMEIDEDLDATQLKQAGGPGKKKQHDPLKLLSFIKERTKENPVSVSEWAKLANVPRVTLIDYLDDLRSWGLIATVGEGYSARKYITEKGVTQCS